MIPAYCIKRVVCIGSEVLFGAHSILVSFLLSKWGLSSFFLFDKTIFFQIENKVSTVNFHESKNVYCKDVNRKIILKRNDFIFLCLHVICPWCCKFRVNKANATKKILCYLLNVIRNVLNTRTLMALLSWFRLPARFDVSIFSWFASESCCTQWN